MGKFILNFTPTGMIPTKGMTPYVPISPQEIIDEVLESRKYGVSIVHLHARDKEGHPTWEKEVYQEIIEGIRAKDGNDNNSLIICVSTSGRNWPGFEKRSDCLNLSGLSKPDMASLTLSSLNFTKTASINSPETIQMLASKMLRNGIKPELEVFDSGMINYAKYLYKKGLIQPPFYFNMIFGNIAGMVLLFRKKVFPAVCSLLAIIFYFTFLTRITESPRLRIPFVPFISMLVGFGFVFLLNYFNLKQIKNN